MGSLEGGTIYVRKVIQYKREEDEGNKINRTRDRQDERETK